MDPVVEILRAQLPIEEESDAFREDTIQIFHSPGVALADALDDLGPTRAGPGGAACTNGLSDWYHFFDFGKSPRMEVPRRRCGLLPPSQNG